jgi:hypothetical protein
LSKKNSNKNSKTQKISEKLCQGAMGPFLKLSKNVVSKNVVPRCGSRIVERFQ